MSSSSAHSSPSSHSGSSHSGFLNSSSSNSSSSHSDTLQLENIEEHPKDTLPHSADSFSQPENSTMTGSNRSKYRNVHIFNASDRNITIGGLILTKENNVTNCVTNANFYAMVEIIVIVTSNFTLRNESNITIEKDNSPLQPGNYYIDSPQPFEVNDEVPLTRTISLQAGTRVQSFRDVIRLRDQRCVITGIEYLDDDNWSSFEAAHIFPLAYEQHWAGHKFSRWISILPDSGGSINSVQNGLLLRRDIHQLFDIYIFSINPDDNYKIVCFARDANGIAGKHLDQRFLDDPQRPVDQLLRWHFRQAVFVNMKGAGEPLFEHDFPPGSDMIGSILKGPKASERMQFELFNRMATQFDLVE